MVAKRFFATRDELLSVYEELRSMAKVATRYGVSKKLILKYMKDYGIDRNPVLPAGRFIDKIKVLAKEGKTSAEIAEKVGITAGYVGSLARGNSIKVIDQFHKGHIVTDSGYRMIKREGHPESDCKGYVREHRIVAEEKIGRLLLPHEVVHHRNGDKLDNSPNNLEVMDMGDHVRHHHTGKKGRGADKKPRKRTLKI